MRAGQAHNFTQVVDEKKPRLDFVGMRFAVDCERDLPFHVRIPGPLRAASPDGYEGIRIRPRIKVLSVGKVSSDRALAGCRTIESMRVIADLCLVPLGVGVSVSREIAACERVLAEAGLKVELHAYGTNIEGEWDEVFAAIKRCHEVVHAMGAPRISSNLRFGTRTDRQQTMEDKVRSVEEKLAGG